MGKAGKKIYKVLNVLTLGIIDDIKWIGIIIKRVIKKEPVVNPEKWKEFKGETKDLVTNPKQIFTKTFYMWSLVFIFAMVVSWMVAAQYYEVQCNNFIIKEYWTREMARNQTMQFRPIGWETNSTDIEETNFTLLNATHPVNAST